MTNENEVSKEAERPDLLEMVTRFYQNVFKLSPEELVPRILTEAARVFSADIATWFLVSEDRTQLRLVDVYNDQGKRHERPDISPYELNWDAKQESEAKGLTAWIAISGKPLFVPSLESLLEEHGKAHKGKWDRWLYPRGITDKETGFLCLYAVPLFLPIQTDSIRDRTVGVLKMERRRKRERPFAENERKAFDVIANIMGFAYSHSERQRSLTMLDIGHTLIRPLGDVAVSLDIVVEAMKEDQNHERELAASATKKLRALSQMLSIAKDGFNNPQEIRTVNLREEFTPQLEAIKLQAGIKILDLSQGKLIITITKRALASLLTIVVNLIDNAIRYGNPAYPIEIRYIAEKERVLIQVENQGIKIPDETLKEARSAQGNDEDIFKGLPRSYQLAARNGWEVKQERLESRNRFEISAPLNYEYKP
jgi:signal transduction histidine kinase